jgi:iron complex outermembrane recepter protein
LGKACAQTPPPGARQFSIKFLISGGFMQRKIALAGAIALLSPPSVALAQQGVAPATPSTALEEVVVTAQRRSENLQKVPLTVTAVSNAELAASHVTNIQQLSTLVPSLSVVDPTGYTMAYIRGIGSSTLGGGTFSSVANYIDGVYIARTTSTMFEFDGGDSVQVLAGPQGALYGRNATAGAIVISSRKPKPGDPLSGSLTASLGNYGIKDFSGSLSSGIGDKFAFTLNAAKHDHDGFVKNLNQAGSIHTEDLDDRDAVSTSVTLVFNPNERASFSLRGLYGKSNDHSGGGYQAVGMNTPNTFVPTFSDLPGAYFLIANGAFCADPAVPATCPFGAANAALFATEIANNAVFATNFAETYDNQRSGYSNGLIQGTSKPGSSLYITNTLLVLNASFNFDTFMLRSATGYTDSEYHGSVQVGLEKPGSLFSQSLAAIVGQAGATLNATGSLGFSSTNPSQVFSQGFQFLSNDNAHVKWIGGVDYSKERAGVIQTGDTFGGSALSTNDRFTVESSAVFAQATIPFAANWSGTLGGRYTDETYRVVDLRVNPLPTESLKGKKFTYTARLERQAEDWLAFGGVSTGFKTGTLNAATAGGGSAKPEEVTTIELGIKRDFVPRYRLNASVYYSTYKNVQINYIDQRTGGNFLANGPKAEVKGIDLQSIAKVTNNFQLSLGATLLDAKFTENNVISPDLKGKRLPGSAKLAVSLVGDLQMPLASGGSIGFTPTVVYNSGKFYDQLNFVGSGGATSSPYTVVNLNLEYKPANDHWSVALWGNNVLDEKYYRTGILALAALRSGREAISGNPATFGVSLKAKF